MSNRGVAVSARRLCHRKRVKRVLQRRLPIRTPRKSPRPAVAHPRVGPRRRRRLQSPRRTKEAQCLTRLPSRPRKRPLPSLLPPSLPPSPLLPRLPLPRLPLPSPPQRLLLLLLLPRPLLPPPSRP